MKKKYGMYGGKFCPMHLGHIHCIEKALDKCEYLYLILFINGAGEQIAKDSPHRIPDKYLTEEFRSQQLAKVLKNYPRVIPRIIDVSKCKLPNGDEDWDAETPLVLAACPERFEVVFGSEPDYADYFSRAYPWATYEMIDPDRNEVDMSATLVRNMSEETAKDWMY